ncbi:hypothetical protein RB195_014710 [Necator americanus]|uniref:Neuropeptide-like protein 31 family protein n=3 Tax=Necator americanus TaxID=51031 RepID=A0ABR1E1B4_NECAM
MHMKRSFVFALFMAAVLTSITAQFGYPYYGNGFGYGPYGYGGYGPYGSGGYGNGYGNPWRRAALGAIYGGLMGALSGK